MSRAGVFPTDEDVSDFTWWFVARGGRLDAASETLRIWITNFLREECGMDCGRRSHLVSAVLNGLRRLQTPQRPP